MRLDELLAKAGLTAAGGDAGDAAITGFAIDHRKVAPGTVFGAFAGARFNGEDFIPAAIEAGAVAIVARPEARVEGALHIKDAEPRRAFARLAAGFFAPYPATIVAVTGTNGKTSTVEMTRQIWRMAGERAASIGTLGVTTPDGSVSTGLTTPDIVTFLANMAGLAREGVSHVAYEASSHGLDQYRNEGLTVSASAFTNFTRDHLDYHGTMEAYFAAKMRLFTEVVAPGSPAIIHDAGEACEWTARAIAQAEARGLQVLSVGEGGNFLRLTARKPGQLGQVLHIEHEGGSRKVNLPLIGAYQAANALVAAGFALATGVPASTVFDALGRLQPVRGRLERAAINAAGAPAYVDYAHTPDALEAAIAALRPHVASGGRLIVVFGAGGDRDVGKRPEMGAIAARDADVAIVTDDNPRSEDPAAIRAAIMAGGGGALREIGDRRAAIAAAIAEAGASDIVLIAGKGHEQGQIFGSGESMRIEKFDDVEVARECAGAGSAGA
ncbi:MAG: UDP-N-acetylmuramoyl-L-alanyl-D-glutamate--2,6-diaminopimelate ligase [Erythrobacter sp.]|jgi:UDP-N-acetylmuramoyl-L-alanyl-D-glutamate--2,6-diaminopimelate ligase|uniref:UDP-N-acetylmuramoyl-L-alanyl-D-glutamate--2, 6-diaminopimelate ligase n=1 Tax=Erythrobacter sp. TaxID=1042 RepID=UPI002B492F39|nr:UDP-N-acetylmuramoyl-L-alanyl-D-glutamate--2,6-diaminopimelate ligase [Erythrobacter sp.]WRH70344.1 MAG: UDP-N-acetylmuramoyl-L-alanyl-D-glutamate--2,6-diaminopimelate ligase [Erythrobacter sp.]